MRYLPRFNHLPCCKAYEKIFACTKGLIKSAFDRPAEMHFSYQTFMGQWDDDDNVVLLGPINLFKIY